MLAKFSKMGFIIHNPYGPVELTEKGKNLVKSLEEQQLSLQRFFKLLGIEDHIAEEDACRIKRMLNEATKYRIARYVDFIEKTYSVDHLDNYKKYLKKCRLE